MEDKEIVFYSIYTNSVDRPAVCGYPLGEDDNLVCLDRANGMGFTFWYRGESGIKKGSTLRYYIGYEFRFSEIEGKRRNNFLKSFKRLGDREDKKLSSDPRIGIFFDGDTDEMVCMRVLGDNENMVSSRDELMQIYDEFKVLYGTNKKVKEKTKGDN